MNIDGKHFRTIWLHPHNSQIIQIIDQRKLPFEFAIEDLTDLESVILAIRDMHVRGAGLIGATAAYGMYLAALHTDDSTFYKKLKEAGRLLSETRPTAVNLQWAIDRQLAQLEVALNHEDYVALALKTAHDVADEDAEMCKSIGMHGLSLLEEISNKKNGGTVNVLTHCNAGWLAFVDYGSATSPIYQAHDKGIDIHVWVDETRPRNQGARLTAWELGQHGVKHTVIPDNAGGHLMQHGMVDIVITGADRVTKAGDAANKIGTYLKALAAKDSGIPFYVALPSSTFDWTISDGINQIPIEQRDGREVKWMQGLLNGNEEEFLILPFESPVANFGFDVTPAKLISGLITERGICDPTENDISRLFPEYY